MPRTAKAIRDSSLLAAALEGLELQKRRIDDPDSGGTFAVRQSTGRRGRPPGTAHKRGPGRMSAAARKRIAAAQKRRWAEYRKSAGKAE